MRPTSKARSLTPAASAGTSRARRAIFGIGCLCVLALTAFLGSGAPSVGAAESFPGQGFLPDNRAWELVSPPDKNGGGVIAAGDRIRIADDGSAASFTSLSGFADAVGSGVGFEYLAQRSTDPSPGNNGWSTHAITPPQDSSTFITGITGSEPHYQADFSADLSRAVFRSISPIGAPDPLIDGAVNNLYVRDDLRTPGAGSYELASPCPGCADALPSPTDGPLTAVRRLDFAAAAADFSKIIFEGADNRALGASGSGYKLHEWDAGTLRLTGVLPNGVAAVRSRAGQGVTLTSGLVKHATRPISADGSSVVFTVPNPNNDNTGVGAIYRRIAGRTTIQLNASELPSPGAPGPATYWSASGDHSRVFFTTTEQLTEDVQAGGNTNLYMWKRAGTSETQQVTVDAAAGTFTLSFNGGVTAPLPYDASADAVREALEALRGPAPLEAPLLAPGSVSVTGGPGSPGGATPYQVTFDGDLAGVNVPQLNADSTGLSGGGATASVSTTAPVANLTFLNADAEPTDTPSAVQGVLGASEDGSYVYFVAAGQLVAGKPSVDFGLYLWHDGDLAYIGRLASFPTDASGLLDGTVSLGETNQAEVTPDGRHLFFMSGTGEGLLSAHGVVDYDHGDCHATIDDCHQFYVYSADSDDLQCISCNPSGAPATVDATVRIRRGIGGTTRSTHTGRLISEDGRYAFFSTAEKLLAADTNGVPDAYVFDTVLGKPSLISSGKSKEASYFIEASADGRDAFFLTREKLSAWDFDPAYDLYDARIDGGFPEPPPAPPGCVGDACQPAPAELNDPTPASAGFHAPGDPALRCDVLATRAERAAERADRLARRAKRTARHHEVRAKQMKRQARRLSRRAAELREQAKRCRVRADAERGAVR